MKKVLATIVAALGVGGALVVPPARAAGTVCPKFCILEGQVEGTGIMPGDVLETVMSFTGVDLRNDIPVVTLGLVHVDVAFTPMHLAAPPAPQMKAMSGTGTATIVDDDAGTPDRLWRVAATRSGTVSEGTIALTAIAPRSNLREPQSDVFSMRLGYRTTAGVTTFAGTFEEHYDGTAPVAPAPIEQLSVDPADTDGVTTATALEAGAAYKLTVSGVVDYDNIRPGAQLADAECSRDSQNPSTVERQSAEVPRWQPQRYFLVAEPTDAPRTDFFDPDPTDDLVDLYVDGRAVDWVPNDPDLVNRMACNEVDHTYVALFTPTTTRPVELRMFDLQYVDNGCATAGCPNGALHVAIEKVADRPVPGADGPRLDSTLVHTGDADGISTRPLVAGRSYAVEIRGMYKYQGAFGQALYADAECVRAGAADNGLYRPHRYDGAGGHTDPLDVYVDGAAVDWEPLGRTPSAGSSADTAQCSPVHAYTTTVVGDGTPLHLLLRETGPSNYSDNAGTLRVDVVELP